MLKRIIRARYLTSSHIGIVMKHLESPSNLAFTSASLYFDQQASFDQVCYVTDIVGWEDKRELAKVKAR